MSGLPSAHHAAEEEVAFSFACDVGGRKWRDAWQVLLHVLR